MSDDALMDLALAEARKGLGRTAPNPSVGAVVVKGGVVLGRGYTRPVGGPHAEVVALADARARGHDPRGATMFVTLEPCCHHGRTPPCTDAILAAGIARVVVGVVDPYPPMRGNALRLLEEGGVDVALGIRAEQCAALVRGFTRTVTVGLPEVTLKVATTLDGRIATASGESQWITGEAARAHAHGLRAEHDAIVVGVGTVLADDPRLTCRVAEGADPVPVVLDTRLRTPPDAAVLAGPRRAVIVCGDDAPVADLDADIVRVPVVDGHVHLRLALEALAARGLHRALVEGGGEVLRAFVDLGVADTLHVYVAGTVIPGGLPWLGGAPVDRLADAPRFGAPAVTPLGDDVLLTYTVPGGPHER